MRHIAHRSSHHFWNISFPNPKIVCIRVQLAINESLHCIRDHPHDTVSVNLWFIITNPTTKRTDLAIVSVSPVSIAWNLRSDQRDRSFLCRRCRSRKFCSRSMDYGNSNSWPRYELLGQTLRHRCDDPYCALCIGILHRVRRFSEKKNWIPWSETFLHVVSWLKHFSFTAYSLTYLKIILSVRPGRSFLAL